VLRVVRRDGEADLGVGLKAPIGGEHQETGRLERVLRRQKDTPMIDASLNFIIMSCECIATSARVAAHAQNRNTLQEQVHRHFHPGQGTGMLQCSDL